MRNATLTTDIEPQSEVFLSALDSEVDSSTALQMVVKFDSVTGRGKGFAVNLSNDVAVL